MKTTKNKQRQPAFILIIQHRHHGEKILKMIKPHEKLGRSLSPTPGLRRFIELLHEWKINKKDRKIDKLPALTFEQWAKKNGYDIDAETSKAVKESPTRL